MANRENGASPGNLAAQWNTHLAGPGSLERANGALRFVNVDTTRRQIATAQIDDYQGLLRRQYRWQPPLTLNVRARFSHPATQLMGTAGFGFWNDPFMMTGRAWPTLPRALWFFFASPPSDMRLDLNTPGHGWKATTIDATRLTALAWAPLAPFLIPLMNARALYRALWPRIQRALGVCEAAIDADMTAWHSYDVAWGEKGVRFSVDQEPVLACDTPPRGPLGFVMWFDNQYMVATPWGRFRYGWLDAPGVQWMEVARLEIAARGSTEVTEW